MNQNDLDWFAARLAIAVYETNRETPEMSVLDLRAALRGVDGSETLTVSYATNGNQLVHIGDKTLEIGPMASNDEIVTALQNPFIRTENTRLTVTSMAALKEKLLIAKGIAPKAASALEAEADALIAKGAEVTSAIPAAFAPHKEMLDEQMTALDDVKDALKIMSNGDPA